MFYAIIMHNDAQAIYKFDTLAGAKEKYHSELAYAYNQGISCTAMVIGKDAMTYCAEVYTAPMEVAEEE